MKSVDVPTKVSKSEYIFWIDLVKGSAIIGIVLFHLFQNYPDPSNVIQTLARIGAKIGFAGVDIFFLIAGFNISYSFCKKGVREFKFSQFNWLAWLTARGKRLYPTYFLACLFVLLTYWVSAYQVCSPLTPNFWLSLSGLAGYIFQCFNPGFWFFTVILEAYLITPILFSVTNGNLNKLLILTFFLATITKILCYVFPESSAAYGFVLQNNFIGSYIGQYGLGLYLGIDYFNSSSQFSKTSLYFTVASSVVALILYIQLSISGQDFRYMAGFDLVFTPALFFAAYYLCKTVFVKFKAWPIFRELDIALRWTGQQSYQIYLVHQPLLFVLLAPMVNWIKLDNYLEVLSVCLVALILLTFYVYLFISLGRQLNRLALKKIS